MVINITSHENQMEDGEIDNLEVNTTTSETNKSSIIGNYMISASPNWYLPQVLDVNINKELIGYGANCSIVINNVKTNAIQMYHENTKKINAVCFIKDEHRQNWIVAGSKDKKVMIIEGTTGTLISSHEKHQNEVWSITTSKRNCEQIISAEQEGNLVFWNIKNILTPSFKTLSTNSLGIKAKIGLIQSCEDFMENHIIIAYQNGIIVLFNYKSNKIVQRFVGHTDSICAISFCCDLKEYFTKNKELQEKLLSKEAIGSENESMVLMASSCKDKTVKLWNIKTGRLLYTITLNQANTNDNKRKIKDPSQRFWAAVCWDSENPLRLFVSSHGGDLYQFQLKKKSENQKNYKNKKKNKKKKLSLEDQISTDVLHQTDPQPEAEQAAKDDKDLPEENDFEILLSEKFFIDEKCCIQRSKFLPGKGSSLHARSVFSIVQCRDTLLTTSMDRLIGHWDIQTLRSTSMSHSIGGFVYSLSISHLQPSCLAIGIGDQSILLWNTPDAFPSSPSFSSSSDRNIYDIQMLWKGIQSKVTCLKWHPTKEGNLCFGTEDGRVGFYDVYTNKFQLVNTKHKGQVLELHWRVINPSGTSDDSYILYTLGQDGYSYIIDPRKPNGSSIHLVSQMTNSKELLQKQRVHSISFHNKGKLLAVGLTNGVVLLLESSLSVTKLSASSIKLENFNLVGKIQLEAGKVDGMVSKLKFQSENVFDEQFRENWLAVGFTSGNIIIADCSNFISTNQPLEGGSDQPKTEVLPAPDIWMLPGHSECISSFVWSPHNPSHLLSSSFDSTIQLWDTRKNNLAPLANFRGHFGRVFDCCFSLLSNDIIFSGSEDQTCRMWNISEQKHTSPPPKHTNDSNSETGTSTEGGKRRRRKPKSSGSTTIAASPAFENIVSSSNAGDSEIVERPKVLAGDDLPPVSSSTMALTQQPEDVNNVLTHDIYKLANKSLFTSELTNQTNLHDFCTLDVDNQNGNPLHNSLFYNNHEHTQHLLSDQINSNTEQQKLQSTILEYWRGNTTMLEGIFADQSTKGDNLAMQQLLLPIAPSLGHAFWKNLVVQHARLLEKVKQYHIAVLYYLSIFEITAAISVYERAEMYTDAILLAKIRLGENSDKIPELYKKFAVNSEKKANYKAAVNCYLFLNQPAEAIRCLLTHSTVDTLTLALEIAQHYQLEETVLAVMEKLYFYYQQHFQLLEAKSILLQRKHNFLHLLFQLAVEYSLNSLDDHQKFVFASSRSSVIHNSTEKGFASAFPTVHNFIQIHYGSSWVKLNAFLDKLCNFAPEISWDEASVRRIKHCLLEFYQKQINSFRNQTESEKIVIAINMISQSLIEVLLSQFTPASELKIGNLFNSWLEALAYLENQGNYKKINLFLRVYFPDLDYFPKFYEDFPQPLKESVAGYLSISELIQFLEQPDHFPEFNSKIDRIQCTLLNPAWETIVSLKEKIERKKEEIHSAMHLSFIKYTSAAMSKKNKKRKLKPWHENKLAGDSQLEHQTELSNLQMQLNEMLVEYSYPFPNINQSKIKLAEAMKILQNK